MLDLSGEVTRYDALATGVLCGVAMMLFLYLDKSTLAALLVDVQIGLVRRSLQEKCTNIRAGVQKAGMMAVDRLMAFDILGDGELGQERVIFRWAITIEPTVRSVQLSKSQGIPIATLIDSFEYYVWVRARGDQFETGLHVLDIVFDDDL